MKKQDESLIVRCDCFSEVVMFDYIYWGEYDNDKDCDLSIGMLTSHPLNPPTFWGRVKLAIQIIFGKELYHDNTSLGIDKIKEIRDFFNRICQDNQDDQEQKDSEEK